MLFVKNADIVIYVFDQSSRQSLSIALEWHERVLLQYSGKVHFLVGNKSDLATANVLSSLLEYPELQYLTVDARCENDVKQLFATFINSVDHSVLEIESDSPIVSNVDCCTCQ